MITSAGPVIGCLLRVLCVIKTLAYLNFLFEGLKEERRHVMCVYEFHSEYNKGRHSYMIVGAVSCKGW